MIIGALKITVLTGGQSSYFKYNKSNNFTRGPAISVVSQFDPIQEFTVYLLFDENFIVALWYMIIILLKVCRNSQFKSFVKYWV